MVAKVSRRAAPIGFWLVCDGRLKTICVVPTPDGKHEIQDGDSCVTLGHAATEREAELKATQMYRDGYGR